MKIPLQTKFFLLFVSIGLIMTVSISFAYYTLTRRDKQRESRERLQIAFDILLDSHHDRIERSMRQMDDFLRTNGKIGNLIYLYRQEGGENSKRAIGVYLVNIANELQQFAHIASTDRLTLYDSNKRLLALYIRQPDQEILGGYVNTSGGKPTYLPLQDPEVRGRLLFDKEIEDIPLPAAIPAETSIDPSTQIRAEMISENGQVGIRIMSPIVVMGRYVGLLLSDLFYTQPMMERYAALTQTEMSLFSGAQFSVGTLTAQKELAAGPPSVSCDEFGTHSQPLALYSFEAAAQKYYQAQCAFPTSEGHSVALVISLSHRIEEQAIAQIVKMVVIVASTTVVIGFALSILLSRPSIRAIRNMVQVISAVAEGDLRQVAVAGTRDEIGELAEKLNKMIRQLCRLSMQVREASHTVNKTADVILEQMDTLVHYMEQESASVENTTISAEKIKQFIGQVATQTGKLFAASELMLVSIQETRYNIDEVTQSTGTLFTHVQRIVTSIDEVEHTVRNIGENSAQLAEVAQQTEQEVARVDHSLQKVSQHARQSEQLAEETKEAAIQGQSSVQASIQGITDLKTIVGDTAAIIQEVNKWGEQVSSILDIVDDITEQTSLLSLNASIISAQAGTHGRGFAVVAGEIKELATRTKASTRKIADLIQALQRKTGDGVKHIAEGMEKADQSVALVYAVKDALETILDSATRTSARAADTALVIRETVNSSQIIHHSMTSVTDMAAQIRQAIRNEEQNIGEVVSAVETIRDMAKQVNRATVEQRSAASQIAQSMEDVTAQFTTISKQTEALNASSEQIVEAMHIIESTSEKILENATNLSNNTVKNLIAESDMLMEIVNVFKMPERPS